MIPLRHDTEMDAFDKFLAGVKERKQEKRRAAILGPPPEPVPITALTLIIHVRKCRHCGAEERVPNRHLLATYRRARVLELATYIGPVPVNVPLRRVVRVGRNGPDWCEECWSPTDG